MKARYLIVATCVALLLAFASVAYCQDASYKLSADARQQIYTRGVPHIDVNGKTVTEFDPTTSFFPILLYHATDFLDTAETMPTPFDKIREAGFNGVHTSAYTKSGMTQAYMDRLQANGLRMVKVVAEEKEVKQFASHPAMLAWNVMDEPEADGNVAEYPSRFDYFNQRVKMIRETDKVHPAYVNTTWIQNEYWTKWQQTGDIASQDNYIVGPAQPDSWSKTNGIPENISQTVKLNDQKKPVWFIAQAFSEDKPANWGLPTPVQLRSMVYTAIIHGATAMEYFTMDNDLVRGAGLYGISPEPKERYTAGTGFAADSARRDLMKQLWNTASETNKEIKALTPWILSPTSDIEYSVYVQGDSKTKTPIRTILKRYKNDFVMFAVNIDNAPIDVRIDFDNQIGLKTAKVLYETRKEVALTGSSLKDTFKPFEVHIYKYSIQ